VDEIDVAAEETTIKVLKTLYCIPAKKRELSNYEDLVRL
jgi:hypothetical protein